MLPTLRAVEALGGSSSGGQIREWVVDHVGLTEEQVALTYASSEESQATRSGSIVLDRCDWARSYCKLGGVLESPRRGLFLITDLGREILSLDDDAARARLRELDASVRKDRRAREQKHNGNELVIPSGDDEDATWKDALRARLHRLSSDGFERFTLYLLREFGLVLDWTGPGADEGIDGIGTAPISAVLSLTVAVQAKRYEPSRTVGRADVALLQRDAAAVGAERAVFVTLGRFSESARRASRTVTPTVDLIDGDRLCELVEQQSIGIRTVTQVDEDWFDRFEV